MTCRAIIFDMDGTLLNTLDDIAGAANRVLEARNLPQHPLERYRFFVGEGARRLIEFVLPEEKKEEAFVLDCLHSFLLEYDQTWDQQTTRYHGVDELLDALDSLSIRKAILSNKPQAFTEVCAAKYLSRWRFDAIRGTTEGVPRKPDPEGAFLIAEEFMIPPADFLFVGDTRIDMETAVRSGMTPIGALWGFRSKEELIRSGAAEVLTSPMELLDYINR